MPTKIDISGTSLLAALNEKLGMVGLRAEPKIERIGNDPSPISDATYIVTVTSTVQQARITNFQITNLDDKYILTPIGDKGLIEASKTSKLSSLLPEAPMKELKLFVNEEICKHLCDIGLKEANEKYKLLQEEETTRRGSLEKMRNNSKHVDEEEEQKPSAATSSPLSPESERRRKAFGIGKSKAINENDATVKTTVLANSTNTRQPKDTPPVKTPD